MERFPEAESAFRTALDLLPPVIPGWYKFMLQQTCLGKHSGFPGQSYSTRIAPNHLNVFINLGNLISKNSSRLLEADSVSA
jgi:hypothetical protein